MNTSETSLNALLKPRSIAVVGASAKPGKVGYSVLRNLIRGGYRGTLYAVNPKGKRILDIPTYTSVASLPEPVEVAVLAVPAPLVPGLAEECGQAGTKALVVLAAGFQEVGETGASYEAALTAAVHRYGMRLLGPNCLGIIDTATRLNLSFAGAMPPAGQVGVLSQSGAMGTAILDWAVSAGVGISTFISLGNKADLTEDDFLGALERSPQTKVVIGYLESISDGPAFIERTAALTRHKPCILIKPGSSAAGAKAAGSHTGALTGSADAVDAALRRAGVVRADTIQELFDYTLTFATTPLPKGARVAIITNAGGPGVVTTDAVAGAGLQMAELADGTRRTLGKVLPPEASLANPIDLIGDARANRYQMALSAVLRDRGVDSVVMVLTPQAMTEIEQTANVIIQAVKASNKPILPVFIGGAAVAPGLAQLANHGVAAFSSPDRAVAALAVLTDYAEYRQRPARKPEKPSRPKRPTAKLIEQALDDERKELGGLEAAALIKPYGLDIPKTVTAVSADEAVQATAKLSQPVVMKIDSPDISHKTDVGGVAFGLTDEASVREAYARMMQTVGKRAKGADLRGVTLSPELPDGLDFIVGMKRDPTFGPVMIFGHGGIYVEVFKDVAFGVAPLSTDDAREMIAHTKTAALLKGARGAPKYDESAVCTALLAVSKLAVDFPQIAEIDLNPLRVFQKGAKVLDARVMLAA